MLILTRKTDQGIVFSGNVTIRILSVDGERVKIGIDAPRSVQVLREELVTVPANGNGNGHANGASSSPGANGAAGSSNGAVSPPAAGANEPPAGPAQAVS
jgi:carbon storage regulator CsrA